MISALAWHFQASTRVLIIAAAKSGREMAPAWHPDLRLLSETLSAILVVAILT
jgi:hypothetical protein